MCDARLINGQRYGTLYEFFQAGRQVRRKKRINALNGNITENVVYLPSTPYGINIFV